MYEYPPVQYRPEKSYLGEALITLVLYYLGFGLIGLIANIIFLNNANRDERQGLLVRNKGCLQLLLWVHVIGLVVGCIVLVVLALTGTLAAILAGMGLSY